MKLKLLAILHVLLLLPIFVQAQEHVDLDSRFRQIDEAIAESPRFVAQREPAVSRNTKRASGYTNSTAPL